MPSLPFKCDPYHEKVNSLIIIERFLIVYPKAIQLCKITVKCKV